MMMLNWPTFVLQRRINRPLDRVERVLCDPMLLRAGVELDLGLDGSSVALDKSFGVTFPPFGVDGASWWAPASVRNRHGRVVLRFEVEINAWDANSTELLVRPRAGHPNRWSGRRMNRYFVLGHATADAFRQMLCDHAGTPTVRIARPPLRAQMR